MIPLWLEFADGLGIDFASLDNILLDSEDRPEKEPRAACWPMRVPEDIRVLVKPSGDFYDYETLYHEMGHALHFAFTDPALPYEFKLLGDDGVTEAHAFTLENVFENPTYLREVIMMEDEAIRRLRRGQPAYLDLPQSGCGGSTEPGTVGEADRKRHRPAEAVGGGMRMR